MEELITGLKKKFTLIAEENHKHAAATSSSLAMTNFDIPLTGSMSAGFTLGFMKG
jgi:hypothetical protein